MTYSKPELLAVESALEAIRGGMKVGFNADTDQIDRSPVAAYDADE